MEQLEEKLEEIKAKLQKLPYYISNTHFKVGAKLHSEVFYYAKPLFQDSTATKVIAEKIVKEIEEKFQIYNKGEKLLLIGYEMYSELLLSLVTEILKKKGYQDIKHFVGIDNEGVFSFKPNEKTDMFWLLENELLETCTAIIIVPIASTGNTAVNIKEAVIKEAEKVVKPILKDLGHSDIDLKNEIEKESKKIKFSYEKNVKDYVINVIAAQDNIMIATQDKEKVQGISEIGTNNERQKRLIEFQVRWHLSENCELCFQSKRKALFGTDKSFLTPALIFDYPKGKNIQDMIKIK